MISDCYFIGCVKENCYMHPVDWSGRHEDSCGSTGLGETPQALKRRGGSPARPKVREVPGVEINRPI
jgi:hypothetical protein